VRIKAEEWQRVVESDSDLVLWAGETDIYTLKGCNELQPALWHNEDTGDIWIRFGYFEEVLPKILEIAIRLGGVVQGDDGEYYLVSVCGRETTWERPNPAPPRR
jgi:hypothetical protein